MRGPILLCVLVLLAVAAGAAGAPAAAPAARITMAVSTTTPKVDAPMFYTVKVVDAAGKPLAARLTMRIVDPFGGVHPVEFDARPVPIRNHPFKGTFRDRAEWPLSSVGFGLKFQAVVTVAGKTRVLSQTITPRR